MTSGERDGQGSGRRSLPRPDPLCRGPPLPLASAAKKKRPVLAVGRFRSPEAATGLGEGVIIGAKALVDRLVGGEIVVFPLELAVEPAGHLMVILPISASL